MKGKEKAAEFTDEGYKIIVTGRDVTITDAMKAYAIEKVSKIERFSTRIIDVQVTMDIQKLQHRVDIVLSVDHIKIKSRASSTDMYASIDKAVEKIERQLRRYKKRIQDHAAKALNIVDLKVNVLKLPDEEELIDINMDIEDENQRSIMEKYKLHEIVKQKTIPLKTLTCDEAILRMELTRDAFLIFRSEEDQKLKVIYRRKDDNFGVIEVEA
ncbi:MAG: putative sigma-54 modulation protein [Chlamydiae bacterium]|nr:putative sigma-54 modulation protein [Chlamydiota bacterium]